MKVWMFNHYANIPKYPGGTRHFDLAKQLIEKGHQITIFASSFHYLLLKETKRYEKNYYQEEYIDGVKFVWIKTVSYEKNDWRKLLNMLNYSLNVYRLKNKFDPPDIIIGSTVHPFGAYTASLLAKNLDVPFIFEIRDLWPQTFIDMGLWKENSLKSKFFYFLESKTIQNSNGVIILSPLSKDYLISRYNFREDKICYIPNGVCLKRYDKSLESFSKKKDEILKNKTISILNKYKYKGYFLCIFTGALVKSNNLEFLVKTAAKLKEHKNIKIILIGNGPEKPNLENLIKKYNLNNIEILSPVPKNYVPILLNFAHVLLLVQGKVLWGSMNKLFDYMAASKPIIVSTYAEHNNPIRNIQNGVYVPPSDDNSMKNAILKIYNLSEKERLDLGKKLRHIVEREYNVEILSEKLEKFLLKIKQRSLF